MECLLRERRKMEQTSHLAGDHREEFMNFVTKGLAALAVAAIALPATVMPAYAEGERFVLVSHSPDSDSWWNTIKNAIALAGEELGVTVEYRNPPTGDLADM